MSDEKLEHIRHTLAHLLAAAVLEHYPQAQLSIGPAIDDGFFYDIDFLQGDAPGEDDLKKIEKTMKKLLPSWKEFSHEEVTADKARGKYKGNPYKTEIINDLEKDGATITLYTVGNFTDLCRGGHVDNPAKEIDPAGFKLDRIAGAYWRGDEKNPMIARIYGLAFENKEKLDERIKQIEEAKARDHKKLGKELGIFTTSPLVGQGLPMFTPKGTLIRDQLEGFVEELNKEYGYQKVWIPHMAKPDLYKTSGHWDKFEDDLFHVQGAQDEFVIKPMNCPHHTQIYASQPRSYKDLPVRFHETTTVYRDEQSGELGGLTRVRCITQDDGHTFLRPDQIEDEFDTLLDIQKRVLESVGLTDFWISLSVRDPKNTDAYLGDDAVWEHAETVMEDILKKRGVEYKKVEGEAAFYGPKMDLQAKDSIGREWQLSTIQLDFNMPVRFKLEYIDNDGTKQTPVMIHRAFMGSTERFMGVIIEHFAGALPVWLSPVQVKILPVSEKQNDYAGLILGKLLDNGVRADLDNSNETLGKKIRKTKTEKIPYFLVLGDKEQEAKSVMVEGREGQLGESSIDDFVKKVTKEIKDKSIQ